MANPLLQKYKSNIDQFGCAIVGVSGDVTFCYSIGFAKNGFPDVFIVGSINPEAMMGIINNVFDRWKSTGVMLGRVGDILGGGLDVDLQPIDMSSPDFVEEFICQNTYFYSEYCEYDKIPKGNNRFVQILWPDTNGCFPYEQGYNHVRFEQRMFISKNATGNFVPSVFSEKYPNILH